MLVSFWSSVKSSRSRQINATDKSPALTYGAHSWTHTISERDLEGRLTLCSDWRKQSPISKCHKIVYCFSPSSRGTRPCIRSKWLTTSSSSEKHVLWIPTPWDLTTLSYIIDTVCEAVKEEAAVGFDCAGKTLVDASQVSLKSTISGSPLTKEGKEEEGMAVGIDSESEVREEPRLATKAGKWRRKNAANRPHTSTCTILSIDPITTENEARGVRKINNLPGVV